MRKKQAEPKTNRSTNRSTPGGPARRAGNANGHPAARKMQGTQALAAAFPVNRNRPAEFGDAARRPPPSPPSRGDRQHAHGGERLAQDGQAPFRLVNAQG
jgi:hypothetical protein